MTDEWSNAEMVRALQRMQGTIDALSAKLDAYATHFVPRELHDEQVHAINERHEDLAKWVTDIAASAERSNRSMVTRDTARWVVGTMVVLIVGLATIVTMVAIR